MPIIAPPRCPVHDLPLQCPACLGAQGGKVLSPAKRRQLKQAARRPRPGARGKAKPRKP